MRFLTVQRLYKLDGIIPNLKRLDPKYDIKVTKDSVAPNSNMTIKIFYEDNLVLHVDLGLHPYAINKLTVLSENYDQDFFINKGILIDYARSSQTVLDSLYHFSNPQTKHISELNEYQFKTWLNNFKVRLDKSYSSGSGYSDKLLQDLIEFINVKYNITKPNQDQINYEEYINYYNEVISKLRSNHSSFNHYYLQYDYSTGKIRDKRTLNGSYLLVNLSRKVIIHYSDPSILKSKYGLRFLENGSTYYDPTKFLWSSRHNRWIPAEGLVETSCPHCVTKCYDFDLVGTIGCTFCLIDEGKIHSYSTRVPTLMGFKSGIKTISKSIKPLYLGIEIEYESDNREVDAKITTRALKDHAILKSDGSIHNGFEIVSCPATIDIHLNEYKNFFDMKEKYTTLKGESNTGMHIHFSREYVSNLSVGKLTAFFNNQDNLKYLEKIGGRTLNNYCRQDPKRNITFELNYGKGDRHVILNLTNKSTVEIRMFSTPDSYDDFKTKVEFADAVVRYCSPANSSLSLKDIIKFDNFKHYVFSNAKQYPNLFAKVKGL